MLGLKQVMLFCSSTGLDAAAALLLLLPAARLHCCSCDGTGTPTSCTCLLSCAQLSVTCSRKPESLGQSLLLEPSCQRINWPCSSTTMYLYSTSHLQVKHTARSATQPIRPLTQANHESTDNSGRHSQSCTSKAHVGLSLVSVTHGHNQTCLASARRQLCNAPVYCRCDDVTIDLQRQESGWALGAVT